MRIIPSQHALERFRSRFAHLIPEGLMHDEMPDWLATKARVAAEQGRSITPDERMLVKSDGCLFACSKHRTIPNAWLIATVLPTHSGSKYNGRLKHKPPRTHISRPDREPDASTDEQANERRQKHFRTRKRPNGSMKRR